MNLLRRLFHRLKMHNFNSRPADLSWIYVSRSIPMTLRYSGPKKVQSSSTARMQTHYTILFYSTPLSFCTISPLAHALCLKSFPVSHTKWMRIGLLLSSPFLLLRLQGLMSLLFAVPTNRWVLLGSSVGFTLCLQGSPLASVSWGGHLWTVISLACQAKL